MEKIDKLKKIFLREHSNKIKLKVIFWENKSFDRFSKSRSKEIFSELKLML